MAFQRPFLIILKREDSSEPWGFRVSGGADLGTPPTVDKVADGGLASQQGMHNGDLVIQVGKHNVQDLPESRINSLLGHPSKRLEIFVVREDFLQKPRRGEPPTVKAVVHNQYNSPLHLYSQEKVAETLAYHAQALATEDGLNNIQPVGLPQNLVRSAVLQALNEEESSPNPYRSVNGTTVVQRKTAPPTPPPKPRPPSYGGGSPQQERSYSSTTHVTFSNPGTPGTPPIQQPPFYPQAQQQPQQPTPFYPPPAFQSQHSRQSSYEDERRRQQVQEAELRQRLYEEERLKQAEYEEERFRQLQEQRAQKLQQIQQPQDIRRYEEEAEQRRVQEEIERRRRLLQEEENRRKQEQLRLRQEQEQQRQRYLQEEQQRKLLEQQRQKYLLEEQERKRQLEQQKQQQQQQYQQQSQQQYQQQQQQQQQYQRYLEEQRRAEEQRRVADQRRQQEAVRQRQFEDQQRSQQQTQRQPVSRQWSASESQQRQHQPIPVPSSPQHQEQVGSQTQRWEGKIRQEQQSRMPGTPLGSPSISRRSRDGCWPPKESSVRWTPKTGFSPHLSRQSSHDAKQFVWPPPKSDVFNGSEGFPSRPSSRTAMNAWHPPSPTAGTKTPPFAQSPTLGRRTRDIAWPPTAPESSPKFVPKPVGRGLHEPQEFLHHHASCGIPATYRPPPNSSQFL